MISYEKADIRDIPRLIELRLAYLREDFGQLSLKEEQQIRARLADFFPAHMGKSIYIYAAKADGEVISTVFIIMIPKPAGPMFLCGKTGLVLNVYTCPAFRGQGHAGRLMAMAIEDARAQNAAYLELKATSAGLSLYRSLGFQEEHSKYTPMKYLL